MFFLIQSTKIQWHVVLNDEDVQTLERDRDRERHFDIIITIVIFHGKKLHMIYLYSVYILSVEF